MSAILKHFGVTSELLLANGIGSPDFPDGAVTLEDIRAVVEKIVPVNAGVPLIRLGGEGDGGYLVPDDLGGIEACFSPGVNNFKDFEDTLAHRYQIKAYMCDYSSDVEQLRTPLIQGWQFFDKKWLDVEAGDINLDINQWVAENTSAKGDLLLQMDIEGAEFRNLLHATEATLARFRIIVLEVHSLHLLSNADFLHGVFGPVIDKLARQFACVHYHPNNCCGEVAFGDITVPRVLELTFLRKDRLRPTDDLLLLPHPLDRMNMLQAPPLHAAGFFLANADRTQSELIGLRSTTQWQQAYAKILESNLAEANARGETPTSSATASADAKPAIQRTDLFRIIASLSLPAPAGILQVGASYGQEIQTFLEQQVRCGVFIEPLPEPFAHLSSVCQRTPGMVAIQALCAETSGRAVTFHVASNGGQSSSILPPANHLDEFDWVKFGQTVQLTTTSLDDVLTFLPTLGEGYAQICAGLDTLYMDTQGAELMVLQGGTAALSRMNYVYTEVTRNELYRNAPTLQDLVTFLGAAGFSLNNVNFDEHHVSDALFIRNSLLGISDAPPGIGPRSGPRIIYACPADDTPAGGVKVIYRQAELLAQRGVPAFVWHPGFPQFRCTWFEHATPVIDVAALQPATDFIIIPEIWAGTPVCRELRDLGFKTGIYVQNAYMTHVNADPADANAAANNLRNADLVLSISQDTTAYLRDVVRVAPEKIILQRYSMDVSRFRPGNKLKMITYMPRKMPDHVIRVVSALPGILPPDWTLVAIDGKPESEVAQILGQSSVFLAFSGFEGLPVPPVEAALSGNFVIGYHGQGGREYWDAPNFTGIVPGDIRGFIRQVADTVALLDAGRIPPDELTAGIEALKRRFSAQEEWRRLQDLVSMVDGLYKAA